MYYYIDYKRAFSNDEEFWIQAGMRMNLKDAVEKLNSITAKGWDTRLVVTNKDRHYTMEKI